MRITLEKAKEMGLFYQPYDACFNDGHANVAMDNLGQKFTLDPECPYCHATFDCIYTSEPVIETGHVDLDGYSDHDDTENNGDTSYECPECQADITSYLY